MITPLGDLWALQWPGMNQTAYALKRTQFGAYQTTAMAKGPVYHQVKPGDVLWGPGKTAAASVILVIPWLDRW